MSAAEGDREQGQNHITTEICLNVRIEDMGFIVQCRFGQHLPLLRETHCTGYFVVAGVM